MAISKAAAVLIQAHPPVIFWKRAILAGFLAELGVVVFLSAVTGIYALAIAPGKSSAEYGEFAQNAGYYLAAPVAALATFLAAFWTVRKLDSALVVNGALIGIVATLLSVGFIAGARPQD